MPRLKFDVGNIRVELNLPLKTTAVFKKQLATRKPLQLQERVQHLLDKLTRFYSQQNFSYYREHIN